MNRRLAGRRSPRFRAGFSPTLVLTAILIAASSPTAATSTARNHAQSTPVASQSDPVGALAASLEYDPQQIFRYVSDQIAYQPYAGILRGAAGTLSAHAGNSVDKALLLAALLQDSQVSYRFAQGPLDQATAARIVASLETDAATARTLAQSPLKAGADAIAATDAATPPAATGPLAALYARQAKSVQADGGKRVDLAKTRLGETVTMLSNALDGAGVSLPTGNDVALPAGESANHTWVQMANGASWVDFDPTLPASQPGSLLTQPAAMLGVLPDNLRYQVRFDVQIEHVSGDQLTTDTALTYTGFADELAGVPITFGHVTPDGMKSLGVALSNLLGDGWLDYRPTLQVGSQSVVASDSVGFSLGGGSGIFGEEPSPGASPGPVDGEASAEWLSLQVTPPGAQPSVARRTVFDRLPAELRATNQLDPKALTSVDLTDVKGTGTNDFAPLLGSESFIVATGPTSVAPVLATAADPAGMSALAFHNVRDAMDAAIALDAGARTFIDGPNIASVTISVGRDASANNARIGLDIWFRHHGILPLTGSSTGAARSQLIAGVTDQLAERFAIESLTGTPGAPARTSGVGEVFDAAAKAGIPLRVLDGTATGSLPYDPQATQLIQEALASGNVVVVPSKPVPVDGAERIGWWSIDPKTGATADSMDDGAGQEVVEEAVLINGERQIYRCYGAMAQWASVAIMAAAEMVSTLAESAIFRLWNSGFMGTSCYGG